MRLTFNGVAGQRVSLRATGNTISQAFVTLVRPDGSTQSLGSLVTDSAFYDTATLPSAGAYALAINPSGMHTGGATFTLYDVPADATGALTVGGPAVSVGNTVPGQDIRLTFSGAAGQQVKLAVTGSTIGSAYVTLVRPDGTTQNLGSFGAGNANYNVVTLPASGAYALEVEVNGDYTGGAAFALTNP
jgi:hypothetical protein